MNLSIMTFNIHHGKGSDRRLDLRRMARFKLPKKAGPISSVLMKWIGISPKEAAMKIRSAGLAKELKMEHAYCPSLSLRCRMLFHRQDNMEMPF
ncbi:hypothetical protein P7F88_11095 [Vibrio hannami]|nr:hypothetical protein [Vibrio hannami]MDG3086626.1 hypothetical protein [Vibrio hannami]